MTKSLANETETTRNWESNRPKLKMPVGAETGSYLPVPSFLLFTKRTLIFSWVPFCLTR